MPSSPARRLDLSLVNLLHRASQHANETYAAVVGGSCSLTARQLAVLEAAAESEGASQTALVARTGIDRSTLADIVRRLMREGLLVRRRTRDDARAYAIRVSPAGLEVLQTVIPMANEVDRRLFSHLPEEARQRLLEALASLPAPADRTGSLAGVAEACGSGELDGRTNQGVSCHDPRSP